MRAAIGDMELDEILHDRQRLNHTIQSTVQEGAQPWGLHILRYLQPHLQILTSSAACQACPSADVSHLCCRACRSTRVSLFVKDR